jgi:hypothetical protein
MVDARASRERQVGVHKLRSSYTLLVLGVQVQCKRPTRARCHGPVIQRDMKGIHTCPTSGCQTSPCMHACRAYRTARSVPADTFTCTLTLVGEEQGLNKTRLEMKWQLLPRSKQCKLRSNSVFHVFRLLRLFMFCKVCLVRVVEVQQVL